MLVLEPSKRCTIEQVKLDKWFTDGYEDDPALPVSHPLTLSQEQQDKILDELEEAGLEREAVRESVAGNVYDPLSAAYYLIADKNYRKGADLNASMDARRISGDINSEGKKEQYYRQYYYSVTLNYTQSFEKTERKLDTRRRCCCLWTKTCSYRTAERRRSSPATLSTRTFYCTQKESNHSLYAYRGCYVKGTNTRVKQGSAGEATSQ